MSNIHQACMAAGGLMLALGVLAACTGADDPVAGAQAARSCTPPASTPVLVEGGEFMMGAAIVYPE